MSNVLSVLSFENQEIRLCGSAENPEWVAADVGAVLGIGQSTLSERVSNLPENWKGIGSIDTPGGRQQMLTVTEPGLYELIFRSDKPAAQRFRVWVFEEVLPSIRRTGSYATIPQQLPTQAELTAMLAQETVKLEKKVTVLEKTVADQEQMLAELKEKTEVVPAPTPTPTPTPLPTQDLVELEKERIKLETAQFRLEVERERNRGLEMTIENKKLGRPQPHQPLPDSPDLKQQLYDAVLARQEKRFPHRIASQKIYLVPAENNTR